MAFLDKTGLEHLWAQIMNQLNTKENLDSKTTIISETSTNAQYPGAKAVYDFVTANIPDTSTFAKITDLTGYAKTNDLETGAIVPQYSATCGAAVEAEKATKDGSGNVITTTYAAKTQLSDGSVTKIGNALKVGTATYDGSAAVNAGRRSWYGTCETPAARTAKVVNDCQDFVLETGAKVSIRFAYTNSAGSPTLNVNGTGAKSIYNSNGTEGTLTYRWYPGQVVDFIYDGTYWLLQQPVVATTDYYGASKVESLTLNGFSNAAPSFYAPTNAGTSGYLLKSNGGSAPTWVDTPYIIKSYRGANSNSTWARKWSDGFIECGGLATGNTVNISFLNEYNFATTNYCVALCYQNSDSSAGINIINVSAYNKATTGFTIRNASSTSFKRTWMAFGY